MLIIFGASGDLTARKLITSYFMTCSNWATCRRIMWSWVPAEAHFPMKNSGQKVLDRK